jgi:hypothetical protein
VREPKRLMSTRFPFRSLRPFYLRRAHDNVKGAVDSNGHDRIVAPLAQGQRGRRCERQINVVQCRLQVLIKLLWNIFDPKQMRREGSFVESAKKSGIGRNQ